MVTAPERKTKIKTRAKNKKSVAKVWKKLPWGKTLIVFVIAVLCYVSYIFWLKTTHQLSYLVSLSQEQQVAIGQTIGYAYRNIYGYQEVCTQSGFELKEYPTEFKTAMAEELNGLEQVLARDNLTLDKAFVAFLEPDILQKIHEELYNELKIIANPDDTGISSACQILDQDAADIAQNVTDEIRPFYHEVLTPLFQK